MKNSLLLTVCLSLILPFLANAKEAVSSISVKKSEVSAEGNNRFKAEWRLRLAGSDIKDESEQSKTVDIRADIKAKYYLLPSLLLDIQPSIGMQTGQKQTADGAQDSESRLFLNQAAAHYLPTKYIKLSAGALNQRYSHSKVLVDNIAFPGARAEAFDDSSSFKYGISAESTIPTSTSMSTNTKDLEKTPALHSAQLKFAYQPSRKNYLKNSIGYFVFQNLPSTVAHQSRLLGNDILQISEAQYAFIYKFAGYEASSEFNIAVTSYLEFNGNLEYLKNTQAPEGLNQAYNIGINATIKTGRTNELSIGGSFFRIEPEAAVSYFNASGFETNRIGYSADSFLSFRKEGFKLGLRYIDSQVIYTREPQSREKTLLLMLETFYANI